MKLEGHSYHPGERSRRSIDIELGARDHVVTNADTMNKRRASGTAVGGATGSRSARTEREEDLLQLYNKIRYVFTFPVLQVLLENEFFSFMMCYSMAGRYGPH